MSEKIADALRKEAAEWREEWESSSAGTTYCEVTHAILTAFTDLAERIDTHTPEEPGGEESTPDKPF